MNNVNRGRVVCTTIANINVLSASGFDGTVSFYKEFYGYIPKNLEFMFHTRNSYEIPIVVTRHGGIGGVWGGRL